MGTSLVVLRIYSWLCLKTALGFLRGTHGVLGIKPTLAKYRASTIAAVLSLGCLEGMQHCLKSLTLNGKDRDNRSDLI